MRTSGKNLLGLGLTTGLAVISLAAAPTAALAGTCPNEGVRAESNVNPVTDEPFSSGLPECRAYEMVSPVDKQGHDALPLREGVPPIVAGDGGGIEWEGQGDYSGAENYQVHLASPTNPYVATRTSTGWLTRSGYPPADIMADPFKAFGASGLYSSELAIETVCGGTSVTSAEATGPSFRCGFRSEDGTWTFTPTYTSLTDSPYPSPETSGGSRAGSVYVFHGAAGIPFLRADTSTAGLCMGEGECGGIYEVTGIDSPEPQLQLVNVDNTGNMIGPENGNAVGALPREPAGGAYQAISDDGKTIFFTATPIGGVPTLYARIDAKETVAISNPSPAECTTCSSIPAEGRFQGASANGARVFFTTEQQLLNSDTDESTDLYEYNFREPAGHALTQVSAGGLGDTTPGEHAEVDGVLAVSEDGSHIYFVAGSVLTTLPNGRGETAQSGAFNLYGYDTETHETRFVATLSEADKQLWGVSSVVSSSGSEDSRLAQATPDGRYLVFDTAAALVTEGAEVDTSGAKQVWRYAFQTGKLIRVSVGHEAFAANGNVAGEEAVIAPADLRSSPASPAVNETSRTISEDGRTIAFVSGAALQATDRAGATNTVCVQAQRDAGPGCEVYLWHECTAGACADGNVGEVDLISDGEDPEGTVYAGMSADGADVLFQARAKLVGQDIDDLGDVYDARVDGGFAAPRPKPSCSGEACQGIPSNAPSLGTPSSITTAPSGNLVAPPFTEPEEPSGKPAGKLLTNAQKLLQALHACRGDRRKAKRMRCEKAARKKFSPTRKAAKKH